MKGSNRKRLLAAVSAALIASGCARGAQPLATAVANAETFNFHYLLLHKGADGLYPLTTQVGRNCREMHRTQRGVDSLLNQLGIPAAPGAPAPPQTSIITQCMTLLEYRKGTSNMVLTDRDANGNITRTYRPTSPFGAEVRARLSATGYLEVFVFGIRLDEVSATRTMVPGPMTLGTVEIPGDLVGDAAGKTYTAASFFPSAFQFQLNDVLTTPDRVTAGFNFATQLMGGDTILIILDGELVLRTDL